MKKSIFSVGALILLGLGCAVGYSVKPATAQVPCDCKLEESRAIQGCEIAAIQMQNMLRRCEYKLTRTEEMIQQYCEKVFRESN